MHDVNAVLAVASLLVLAGVLASKLSTRLGVPALLLFLLLGMLAGSDGPGNIDFADYELAQGIGVAALAYILFAGGLDTNPRDIRPVLRHGIGLATVGVVITALVTGALAAWVLDLPLKGGFLLGAIVSSTDAAAVFAVLRSRSVRLKGGLRPLLELESGSNDPMAAFLTIGLLELVMEPDKSIVQLIPLFASQMAVGAIVGVAAGFGISAAVNRLRLEYEGLYPVVTLASVLATYSVAALLQGSGFLAVYLAGLIMADREFLHRRSLVRFHDAFAWLSQIGMFLVLGLLVFPSDLPDIAPKSLAVSAGLIFIARPISVFITLAFGRLTWRERTLVSWVGLRGAVPIILATFPLVEGAPNSVTIFNTVFFIVLSSVLLQGTTIPVVARWLGVAAPAPPSTAVPVEEPGMLTLTGEGLHEMTVPQGSGAIDKALVNLGIPPGTIIVLVNRGGHFIVPQGTSELQEGDQMLVVGEDAGIAELRKILAKKPIAGPSTDGAGAEATEPAGTAPQDPGSDGSHPTPGGAPESIVADLDELELDDLDELEDIDDVDELDAEAS